MRIITVAVLVGVVMAATVETVETVAAAAAAAVKTLGLRIKVLECWLKLRLVMADLQESCL